MLDDEDGVAQIAQAMQDVDQPLGIATMQSDGWFIQHVQRSHQPRTNEVAS